VKPFNETCNVTRTVRSLHQVLTRGLADRAKVPLFNILLLLCVPPGNHRSVPRGTPDPFHNLISHPPPTPATRTVTRSRHLRHFVRLTVEPPFCPLCIGVTFPVSMNIAMNEPSFVPSSDGWSSLARKAWDPSINGLMTRADVRENEHHK
jgi:hypothetical protein